MSFHIGEKVIHSSFGFAEIVGVEDKEVTGTTRQYYVVKTKDMTVWVPTSDGPATKLRPPSTQNDFRDCFAILRSKFSPLSDDRNVRKSSIQTKLSSGTITALCELIRDLSFYKSQNKINDNEKSILERAVLLLTDEWGFAFHITPSQAKSELTKLLNESSAASS